MHWLAKLVVITAGNAFALWLANRWVPGFVLTAPILGLILLGLTLTILNFFLKPKRLPLVSKIAVVVLPI